MGGRQQADSRRAAAVHDRRNEAAADHFKKIRGGSEMFTRQHYKKIAEIIKRATVNQRDLITGKVEASAISKAFLVADLCEFLAADNARFDEAKFREACE